MAEQSATCIVKVNEFEIPVDDSLLQQADLVRTSPDLFNLICKHRSVNARLLEADVTGKKLKLEVEGETYLIEIKDKLDQMLDSMGFNTASTKHIKEVKAPMPGLVLEVSVTAGQEVKEGERLLILSAMKMENSILLHADGVIKKVHVSAGQAVDKGQVLVELE